MLPYLLSKLAAELPVGALFPALFACMVYPATGLNPHPARFASFLGLLTLEAMSAQVRARQGAGAMRASRHPAGIP